MCKSNKLTKPYLSQFNICMVLFAAEVTGVVKLNTRVVDKKGRKHLDVSGRDVEVAVKHSQFYFANLFNGNKQLGKWSVNIFFRY